MTFTEAAVEVLRRAGKPLHYREIAEAAVRESLLSHVGQDPEVTMGQRLAAMAKREDDRKVVAIAPEGTFALTEWSVPAEAVIEAKAPSFVPEGADLATPYRDREREPRPINAQARRRMEVIAGHEPDEAPEAQPDNRREKGGGQRRFPPPAEVVFEALAARQSGAPLAELAGQLLAKNLLSDALVRDLPSLTAALLEDNRRRTEVGRKPAFIVDGERVTLVEFPPPSALPEAEKDRTPASVLGRPPTAATLVADFRRATLRALRRRLADLETSGFEHVCAALLEKMGLRDVRVAKRSKEGPLYLARHRQGVSDLRVAVRLVRGQREISRQDVQELRRDLAHYSSQMGLVLAPGEAGREARSEASSAGQAPVALYAGEALAEELAELGVGVAVQRVELADVDEAFFAAAAKAPPGHRGQAQLSAEGERRERAPREGRDRAATSGEGTAEQGDEPGPGQAAPSASAFAGGEDPSEPAAGAAAAEATAQTPTPPRERGPREPREPRETKEAREPREQKEPRDPREPREPREPAAPQRLASPAEQAWGQPAGTPRRAFSQGGYAPNGEPRHVDGSPATPSGDAREAVAGSSAVGASANAEAPAADASTTADPSALDPAAAPAAAASDSPPGTAAALAEGESGDR